MGWILKPKSQPIKHLPSRPIWYDKTEKGHKRFMPALEVHQWSANTGRPVHMKMKKYELDELE